MLYRASGLAICQAKVFLGRERCGARSLLDLLRGAALAEFRCAGILVVRGGGDGIACLELFHDDGELGNAFGICGHCLAAQEGFTFAVTVPIAGRRFVKVQSKNLVRRADQFACERLGQVIGGLDGRIVLHVVGARIAVLLRRVIQTDAVVAQVEPKL